MDLIFSLSEDVAIPLLVEWLDFIDVARFDKACAASRREREILCRVYTIERVVFHNNVKHLVKTGDHLRWLLQRKIKVAKLVVVPQMVVDRPLVESYFKTCGSTIRSLSIEEYNSEIISAAMKYCPRVKVLSIDIGSDRVDVDLFSECVETFCIKSNFGATSKSVKIKFPNMRDRTVVGNGIWDYIFMCILQNTDDLQSLKLDGACALKDRAMDSIGPFCPSLKRLFLCNMDFPFKDLAIILPSTPQLQELSLFYERGGVSARKLFNAVATHCQNLVTLTIVNCDRPLSPAALEAFDRMLAHCANLRTLRMNFCRFVTDIFLLSIASNAKHIERLDVRKCNVSTTGLAQIAQHCTDLHYVSFSMGSGYSTTEECKLLFRKETTVTVNHNDTAYAAGGEFNADDDYSSGDEASDDGEEEGGDWDF